MDAVIFNTSTPVIFRRVLDAALTASCIACSQLVVDSPSNSTTLTLDLFGGSGTTMIAAQQTGRVCFMMELDSKYCDVIVKRYVSQFGADSVFLVTGSEKIPYAETQID
jgi:hypothetical protein